MNPVNPTPSPPARKKLIPGVKNVVAVASGKGGVGKSTVCANLALALAAKGARVGLMDADVYGPSIPTILGISDRPVMAENHILPVEQFGIKVISMGFFMKANEAVIWRGPMLHKMVQDFLGLVDWGDLDYLLVDLPPGTGDIQLSLCQTIPLTGAVIVSTPQDVAWNVAQKAIMMFDKLNAPILGVIENMSSYVCGKCGHRDDIFGSGGARRAAGLLGIPYLGEIPLVTLVRVTADQGKPVVCARPASSEAALIGAIAERLAEQVSIQGARGSARLKPAKIGDTGRSTLEIEWNDGVRSVFPARDLRLQCPCAMCVHEMTGERIVRSENVPVGVHAVAVLPVGSYALQIVWSDGHATGLYGHDYLRRIAQGSGAVG